jgi:multicomponent Na+:H+ antiporter subunit E
VKNLTSSIQKAIILSIVYILITGNLELINWVVALLIGLGVSLLVPAQSLYISWARLPAALWAGLRYLGVLIWDMLVSGLQVAKIIINPDLPINPGVVDIEAGCQSELSTALSAHAITLTPGELVIEMDDQGHLYTHCLDVSKSKEYGESARQIRRELLIKIFE